MAVLKDYFCTQHGIFESREEKCPCKPCTGDVSVVFIKPVGIKSEKTKRTEKTVENLALDFGMTDIKTTREGEHQVGYKKRNNKLTDKQFAEATAAMEHNNKMQQKEQRPGDSVIWGGGGSISMKSIMGGQFKSVNGESVGINPKAAGNLTGPAPASYIADHENLTVKKP